MTCLLHFNNGLYFSPLFWRTNFGIQLLVHFLSCVFLFFSSCSTCCPPKRLACHCSVFLAFLSSTLLTYSSKTNSMFTLFHQILCSPWFSVFPCLGSHFCQGSINPPALFKCYRLREAQLLNVFTLIFIVFLIHYSYYRGALNRLGHWRLPCLEIWLLSVFLNLISAVRPNENKLLNKRDGRFYVVDSF